MTNQLIVYFTQSNNTKKIANMIKNKTNADLFEIKTIKQYPSSYNELLNIAKEELKNNDRPELKENIDITNYDIIYLGFPNWWSNIPMCINTFLESHDFSNKIIAPFCSNGGGGLSKTVQNIIKVAPNAKVIDGLSINYSNLSESQLEKWLNTI